MSSITRHHAEWLSLLEISGPFLSMPVLLETFPQGLEARDPDHARDLRAAHEEWADNQAGWNPDPAIHTAWLRYVLEQTLGYTDEVLFEGQAIPAGLKAYLPEHGETLRPDLVLGFPATLTPNPSPSQREGSKPSLLIQIYPSSQALDKPPTGSRWQASIATRMMELLHATEVRLGLITNGEQWTLVDAPRGETTGFTSWYASLWFEEPLTLRAFRSLLGGRRFFGVPDDKTLAAMLAASAQDQHKVTDQLGYQVRRAVEILIQAIDRADQDRSGELLAGLGTDRLYEAALTVMMRLVFLLSAEERKLLPLDDPLYAQNYAISTLLAQLREAADQSGEDVIERRYDAWSRLLATWRAVYAGMRHDCLTLPAYGGSLFDPDRFPFLEGRIRDTSWQDTPAHPLPIDNRTVLYLLEALQILQVKVPGGGPAEARRLSFRALDVEQIGHVYEGLLDHMAVRADGPVLGLVGTKAKEPEIPLAEMEAQRKNGDDVLIDFLQKKTGRSPSALKKGLNADIDAVRAQRSRAACGNDGVLYKRVLPFAGLVRDDEYGFPVVITAGSVYVTDGPTRRATGTHYTPRSLTEPIVKHTLEPQVYRGPAEGWPREKWELKSPKELLDLKICDMAMGSAGFLVQADRYLSERLVEAWKIAESEQGIGDREQGIDPSIATPYSLFLTPEGETTDDPAKAIPTNPDDRLVLARRLVAERCLYGVDKNPLAVEIAKLSLWLVTLAKERPFTFLDHALKCGDSLVGASEDDFLRWAHGWRAAEATLFDEQLQKQIELARRKRRELESFQVLDMRDAERKAALLAEAEADMARVKLGCDLLVGVKLLGLNQSEQDNRLSRLLLDYVAGEAMDKPDAQRAINAARKEYAIHWEFEFPEVFERGGFSGFVGNPPFIGGLRISSRFGDFYYKGLRSSYDKSGGTADLCAYFFLRGYNNLSVKGVLGLVATNTIAQGDTRTMGLEQLLGLGATIFRANSSMPWPGIAAVAVSVVHMFNSDYKGQKVLDDQKVDFISSLLESMKELGPPLTLTKSSGISYQGSIALGDGFLLSPDGAQELIADNPENKEILFPYINGSDLYSKWHQSPSRWAIYFYDWSIEKAKQYETCFKIVEEKVYPVRKTNKDKQRREIWWRFTRPTIELYKAIEHLDKVLVVGFTSKTLAFDFLPKGYIYTNALVVFALDSYSAFCLLQSSFHNNWAIRYGSTLETRFRYTPTDVFETFPFPTNLASLEQIGEIFHKYRRQIMVARQEGLTATYNCFHDPEENSADIEKLRELHVAMDQAVAAAYGWEDLDLGHGFHETRQGVRYIISEAARREVLERLLELNHQQYEEEVKQGLHVKKKVKRGGRERAEGEDRPGRRLLRR